jgi:hypothetical protein
VKDKETLMSSGIARNAYQTPEFKRQANKALIDFLHEQIADAEWTIARAKAEIAAYEHAIASIEGRQTPAVRKHRTRR